MNPWELSPRLYAEVRDFHVRHDTEKRGHGIGHDLEVAWFGQLLAKNPREAVVLCDMGLGHSRDRAGDTDPEAIAADLKRWMGLTDLLPQEIEVAILGITAHSGPNHPHPLVRLLQYADRIANLGVDVVVRGYQFLGVPVVSPEYVAGERHPLDPTCLLDNIDKVLQWVDPKNKKFGIINDPFALQLAKARAVHLQFYRRAALAQYRAANLHLAPS